MKKIIAILVFACLSIGGEVNAQFLKKGIKLEYSAPSIDDMLSKVREEVDDFSTAFFKQCDAGLLLRLNFGKVFYIQPEVNFSIASVWDSVAAQETFFSKLSTTFEQMKGVNLSVPVLFGAKLLGENNFFSLRLFVGPEFYTTIKTVEGLGFNYRDFSLVAGLGFDLFTFIYVDGRISYMSSGDIYYRLGVGFLF